MAWNTFGAEEALLIPARSSTTLVHKHAVVFRAPE